MGINIKGSTDIIPYVPKWRNIVIEKNLRKFMTNITRTKGLEKFLNQNRNNKYRKLQVDWNITFAYLKGNETYYTTTFKDCRRKRIKIQRLMEEIPTIEQIKKSQYNIYKKWKCVQCNRKKETFIHVWKCNKNKKILRTIQKIVLKYLIRLINEISDNSIEIRIEDFEQLSIFKIIDDNQNLSFIDVIKGIFPLELTDLIKTNIGNQTKKIIEIGKKFLEFVFDILHKKIWKPRCEKMKKKEKEKKITKKMKKMRSYDKNQKKIVSTNQINKYINLGGLIDNIYFGRNILDFIVYVNLVR